MSDAAQRKLGTSLTVALHEATKDDQRRVKQSEGDYFPALDLAARAHFEQLWRQRVVEPDWNTISMARSPGGP